MNDNYVNEESSNAYDVRPTEQKPGLDSRDVDIKPVSPGIHPPATASTAPTTPEAVKKSTKRGKKLRVRLNLFHHKRRKASYLESPTDSEGVLFGHSLTSICLPQPDAATATIPPPLIELLRTLYVSGPTAEGVFRRCANKSACRSVRKQLDSGVDCGPIDVHIASNIFTELLRKLPDCLLCCRMYDEWLESSSKADNEERILVLQHLVNELPACNLLLLRHLICVLHRIDRNSDHSKMTSRNLAVCLGPSLLWSKTTALDDQRRDVERTVTTVRALIDHASDIFGPDCLELFRDSESDAMTILPTDQHDAKLGNMESTDGQCANGSNHPSTTSRLNGNALASTSLEPRPAPVAPPRRKKSSVVAPSLFGYITEESSPSSNPSTNRITEKQVHDDSNRNHSRWLSSDSELSGREYPSTRNSGAEGTTDGETVEDSDDDDETSGATEEEYLEDRGGRTSMLSEDLADEEDSSTMVSPHVGRGKDILLVTQKHGRSGQTENTKNLSAMDETDSTNSAKLPDRTMAVVPLSLKDVYSVDRVSRSSPTSPLSVVASTLSTEIERKKKKASVGLMSFSSTEEPTATGHREGTTRDRRLFFGSSFSSTAGSDAEILTFAESSLDSGMALSESFELPGVNWRWKQKHMNGVSNSSVASIIPLIKNDCHNQDVLTVASDARDGTDIDSRNQRECQIDGKRILKLPVREATDTGEKGRQRVRDDGVPDLCAPEISSVANDFGAMSSHEKDQTADTFPDHQIYLPKSTQTLDIAGQSASISRSHSFGYRDTGGGVQAVQRRGMTYKGSDVFPGILSKTLESRTARVYDPNGLDCKPGSGAMSENEERGGIYYAGKKLTSDDRIVVSDIEFIGSRRRHHTGKVSQNLGSPEASRLDFKSQDGRQLDGDVKELNIPVIQIMRSNEEDEKISSARRSRLEPPPDYDEAVRQLRSQRQTTLVASLPTQEGSILQPELQVEGERTVAKERDTETKNHSETRILDASALAKLATRSCDELSKAGEKNATNDRTRLPSSEHESQLKHVSSLGAPGDVLKKRFCIPRSRRSNIQDSSSSSISNSDGERTSHRRLEENLGKRRIRRKRRSRKARNSDTHLQTERENRVNLVRSKSDSNTLFRELIMRQEDAEYTRESFRKEISRRQADHIRLSRDREEGKENLNDPTVRVKNPGDDASIHCCEVPSRTQEGGNIKSVALKDREWHKNLVREIECTQTKSQSLRYANSGTPVSESESVWQRRSKDLCNASADKFKYSNNTGSAASTLPRTTKPTLNTRQKKVLDYSSSDSNKRSTDETIRISEQTFVQKSPSDNGFSDNLHLGKLRPGESGNSGDSGRDGSGGSTASLIELRVNQLKKCDRSLQKDTKRPHEEDITVNYVYAPKYDNNSNIVSAPENFLGSQTPNQETNTTDTQGCLNEMAYKELSQEFTTQSATNGSKNENEMPEQTSSDLCKSPASQFERISVKDIIAMTNSFSGSASSKSDSAKPPAPSGSWRCANRTETGRPEGGRPVARRASHVIPQVKADVDILLTPELNRKMPPRTEQKESIVPPPAVEPVSRRNPSSDTNRLSLPVCTRSHSVKSPNSWEANLDQQRRKKAEVQTPSQTVTVAASTSEPSPRQRQIGVSKQSQTWQSTKTSTLPAKSSQSFSRKGVFSTEPEKELVKSAFEVNANEKGDKKIDCSGTPAARHTDPNSQGSDSGTDKSTKKEMPWSVANLRNIYGNQNPH